MSLLKGYECDIIQQFFIKEEVLDERSMYTTSSSKGQVAMPVEVQACSVGYRRPQGDCDMY